MESTYRLTSTVKMWVLFLCWQNAGTVLVTIFFKRVFSEAFAKLYINIQTNWLSIQIPNNESFFQFHLDFTASHTGYPEAASLNFDTVQIWGLDRKPAVIMSNGVVLSEDKMQWDSFSKVTKYNNLEGSFLSTNVIWNRFLLKG